MYRILKEEGIPKRVRHIIWDVNGTMTVGDVLDRAILEDIIALANEGIDHSFITGRDRKWLEKMLISLLREMKGFKRAVKNFHFYPELGLMKLNSTSGEIEITDLIENHPITDPAVRQKLAGLFYQTCHLRPYRGKEELNYSVGGDADGNFFLIPDAPKVEFPWFIWSDSKELMGGAEVIRNPDTSLNKTCAAKINESAEKLEEVFKDWGLKKWIKVSPVSTALNLTPVVDGRPLDKDVATGIALYDLSQKLQVNIYKLCSQTVAIGDGQADLLFTTPVLGLIPIFFVGPKSQLRPTVLQKRQVVLVAEGALNDGKSTGPQVTKEVLKLIKSRSIHHKST